MENKNIKVQRPIKMLIGCIFLVISGLLLGVVVGMGWIVNYSYVQIPPSLSGSLLLGFVGFSLIGMVILLNRDEQIQKESKK